MAAKLFESKQIRAVAEGLANELPTLFQPSPGMKPLYDLMIAAIETDEKGNKVFAVVTASFRVFAWRWLAGLAIAVIGIVLGLYASDLWIEVSIGDWGCSRNNVERISHQTFQLAVGSELDRIPW